ncbi:DedA family protein, partial [Carnobacterium sp.]|uniref:DedA family protein n=1 Tax=Carnobacterium sp. TaxID=48221 RepID=UPI0028AA78E4
MEAWIQGIMEQFGYIGVAFLIMIENVFPPIPSEVILTFGGFMTTSTSLTIWGMIIASTIGAVIGAVILYGIGLLLDVERLEKIVDRWGHVLRLTREDIHKADNWFDKYGMWTVFFCRFIPLIRSLISIPAGMSNMNFGIFLALTTTGTLIWNTILIYLGAAVGSQWEVIV